MTSKFDQELYSTNAEFLNTFGVDVLVNGKPYTAIYDESQAEDDTGYRLLISFMFDRDVVKYLRKGDSLIAFSSEYRLKEIPRNIELDSLIPIEVQFVRYKASI